MIVYLIPCFVTFSAGMMISCGLIGFLISLSVLQRLMTLTHTEKSLLIYEDTLFLGTLFGSWSSLFSPHIPFGRMFLLIYGLCSGIFLGGWILSLAEISGLIPVFVRRFSLRHAIGKIIFFLAAGKTLGALLFFCQKW